VLAALPIIGVVDLGAFALPAHAGTQITIASGFQQLTGLAVDAQGDVAVSDAYDDAWEVPAGGARISIPMDGVHFPNGVAVDARGDVFMSDYNHERVVEEPNAGTLTHPAYGVQITVTSGLNGAPQGVAVDGQGDVFVTGSAGTESSYVMKVPNSGTVIRPVYGTPIPVPVNGLEYPSGVAVDAQGNVFIADVSHVVEVSGGRQTTIPTSGLNSAQGLAVDGNDDVFVADTGNNRVVVVPGGGGSQTTIPLTGLNHPVGVAVDGQGNVFVADVSHVVEVTGAVPQPNVTLSPPPNSAGWNNSYVSVSFHPNNAGSSMVTSYDLVIGCTKQEEQLFPTLVSCGRYAPYRGPIELGGVGSKQVVDFYSVDSAGNVWPVESVPVNIDLRSPQTTATPSGTQIGGAYQGPVSVTLSATDDLSGLQSISYSLDGGPTIIDQINGGPNTPYTDQFSVAVPGSHTVTYFSTDVAGNVEPSQSIGFTIIQPTSTTLTSSGSTSVFGQSVTFTAAVAPQGGSGTPTGTVNFLELRGPHIFFPLGSVALNNGQASISTANLILGTHDVTAYYNPSGNFNPSAATTSHTVISQVTLASSVNPAVHGQPITFTANVNPATATGPVTFMDGGTILGTVPVSNGSASLSTSILAVGAHTITASYVDGGSATPLSQTITPATTTTSVSGNPNPVTNGQTVVFTATVQANAPSSSTPYGSVIFLDGTIVLGTGSLSNGQATFSTSSLSVGPHTISAVYTDPADTNFTTSSGTTSQTVQ
jgi:sugar lactone lactonase YvrE